MKRRIRSGDGPLRHFWLSIALLILPAASWGSCPEMLQNSLRKLHSSDTVNLCEAFGGKPLLIINTASHCGYTKQLEGLEALHQAYKDRGLVVVGFSSNDFFQEADDEAQAAEICYINYGVTFTLLAPTHVKGKNANPVFQILAEEAGQPSWNFNKYLVAPDGTVLKRFGSNTKPDDATLRADIEALL